MKNVDSGNLVKRVLAWIARVTVHPTIKPNSADYDKTHFEHAHSGGYNEAFVFEYWASYNPRD